MAVGYHIDLDGGLVTVQARDQVSLADAYEAAAKLLCDTRFRAALPQLVDLRDTRPQVEPVALTAFTKFVQERYAPSIKASVAVLVDQSMDDQSCAAIYWLTCSLDHVEMFDDYDQALKWLFKREFASASLHNPHAAANGTDGGPK